MKKIVFLVLHLGFGGAERAVISEANLLSEFCDVQIISFYKLYETPAFYVNPNVKITYLTEGIKPNISEVRSAIKEKDFVRLFTEALKSVKILYLRKHLMKKAIKHCTADIIISSRYLYHKLLTSNAKRGTICIAQEHNHHNFDNRYIKKQIRAVKHMDYFMPVSRELTEFYSERVIGKVVCKYIPHHLPNFPKQASLLDQKNIISVGRLSPEKGMDELICVFAELQKIHKDWKLHIAGDGAERAKIENLVADMRLTDNVIIHGFKTAEEIAELSLCSSIYVMTSHTESFGIVLIEAMSFGLPCVAYDSAQGATEIIENNVNGFLIKGRSRDDMVRTLDLLINDFELRTKLGHHGRKTAERFSEANVKKLWKDFISQEE